MEFGWIDGEGLVFFDRFGAATLKEAAVEGDEPAVGLDEVHRSGDFLSGSVECDIEHRALSSVMIHECILKPVLQI